MKQFAFGRRSISYHTATRELDEVWMSRTLLLALIVVVGLAMGWMTANAASQAVALLGALVCCMVIVVVVVRPVLAALTVLSFAFINPNLLPVLAEWGEFTVRPIDVAFGVFAAATLIKAFRSRRLRSLHALMRLFGPLLPFFLYVGFSLGLVWLHVPRFFLTSLASYLRLMETVLYGCLLCLSLDSERDVVLLHKGLLAITVTTVLIGIWEAWPDVMMGMASERRYGGLLSINTFGLVSGLLMLYGVIARERGKASRIPLGVAAFGLFLSKSASSILATGGTVMLLGSFQKLRKQHSATRQAFARIITVILVGFAFWTLRRPDVEGLVAMSGGSFAHRLMIAYAAIEIFAQHPLFGTGWQASSTREFIGSSSLNAKLIEAFPNFPGHYSLLDRTASLHNMYLQFLAELGIVGLLLFVCGCLLAGRSVRRFIKSIPDHCPYKLWVRFHGLALIYLLIWWNTNPLYGGQTESILAFVSLAMIAVIGRLVGSRPRQSTACIAQKGERFW